MKGYKEFEKGLVCRGKQYAENAVAEEENAVICENSLAISNCYPLMDDAGGNDEFAEVVSLQDEKTDDGKKFCTTKLKIGAKFSFGGFVNACVDFDLEKTKLPDSARTGSSGKDPVLCCAVHGDSVKAKKGSLITLVEWEYSEEKECYFPKCVKTEYVDGERIKEDAPYVLTDGEFCKADDTD